MEKSWEVDLICRFINVYVACICLIAKLPQIIAIYKTGSKGINIKSLLMEFWCFTILLAYPCANGYPVSAYGEFLLLVGQDIVILLLVLSDRNIFNTTNSAILGLYLVHVYSLATNVYPTWILYSLMSTVTPMAAVGKVLQIYSIVSARSAGSVSALSWALGTSTAGARVFTLMVDTGDRAMMFVSGQAAVLNGLIALSAFTFRTRKEKQS